MSYLLCSYFFEIYKNVLITFLHELNSISVVLICLMFRNSLFPVDRLETYKQTDLWAKPIKRWIFSWDLKILSCVRVRRNILFLV